MKLSKIEKKILKYISCGKTYKDIAASMDYSMSGIYYYTRGLFKKFGVDNRTGLTCEAFKKGLIK